MRPEQQNEWVLYKPTPIGNNVEEWRFVLVSRNSRDMILELYHKPGHGKEYKWGVGHSLEFGRNTWKTLVNVGFDVRVLGKKSKNRKTK